MLDMGECRVRFKRLDQQPLDAIGQRIANMLVNACIADHEADRGAARADRQSG